MRRCVPLSLALVALAGCGDVAEDREQIRPWVAEAPYLPPRAPQPAAAVTPAAAATETVAPEKDAAPDDTRAPTDEQVARELEQAFKGKAGSAGDLVDQASLTSGGLATVPPSAPAELAALINAANQVARKPYVYGGGHGGGPEGLFTDTAYDCSGSISYALAAAGFIKTPMASGPMMTWGKPGKGKWVTIYANEGHAFMVVAGLRFDTSGRAKNGTRWQVEGRSVAGMVARHPPGL